jgi:hypothetical protein
MGIDKKKFIIFFVLCLLLTLLIDGCTQKPKPKWVNTSSMPGHAFDKQKNTGKKNVRPRNSSIVYLGSDENEKKSNFGPRDVSFEFNYLK